MLHYNPRHVSSINMPIFRRTNCINTASGIITVRKRLYSMPDESRLPCRLLSSTCPSSGGQIVLSQHLVSSLSVQPFTESDDTRCCVNTICPPEDGHVDA